MTLKLIAADKFGAAVDAFAKRGKALDHEAHVLAVSALTIMAEHNDVGPVNRLYKAMGKGARKAALTSWFITYGAVLANTGKDKADKPFVYNKAGAYRIEAGTADPWFEHKPDPEPDAVLDVLAMVKIILSKAAKARDKGTEITGEPMLAKLAELVGETTTATTPDGEGDGQTDTDQSGTPQT